MRLENRKKLSMAFWLFYRLSDGNGHSPRKYWTALEQKTRYIESNWFLF